MDVQKVELKASLRSYDMDPIHRCYPSAALLGAALILACSSAVQPEQPYLGLEPPGMEPIEFAPTILSGASLPHSRLIIAPDGEDLYWNGHPRAGGEAVLFHSTFDGTSLTTPAPLEPTPPFYSGRLEFSEDGREVFYDAEAGTTPGLWYVRRTESGWSDPMPIVPNQHGEWASLGQPSVSRSKNLYYTGRKTGDPRPSLYWSRFVDGTWTAPQLVPLEIGSGAAGDPYVDPEERYLLFTAFERSDADGPTDLFVSYRNGNGSWGEPRNLGDAMATPDFERFPSVSRDGRFLFFVKTRAQTFPGDDTAFYWVSAEVLERLGR